MSSGKDTPNGHSPAQERRHRPVMEQPPAAARVFQDTTGRCSTLNWPAAKTKGAGDHEEDRRKYLKFE
ncbi:hypothetical protein IE4771_CH00447 [Rhizobium etli bv. mimosae str. IE4771]|uniref:Uncharacterized protein n=1 Tax=Rhizobium etli bv. mimosae str. IE4771 TaxID=1432050 RepID=A0A060HVN2_RHIET|nr:hypothetical protein IE4771_CH00447 [Rhizobium sp. IE4771]